MDVAIEQRSKGRVYALWGLVAIALGGASLGLARLERAAPVVPKASVWIGRVQRGALVREVSGPGRLVPEAVRVISAAAAGTVEVIHVKPGAEVDAGTALLELANPELELKALEIAGEVKGAEAQLLDLKATLAIQAIEQRGKVHDVAMRHREATRLAGAKEMLASRDMVAPLELAETRERAESLAVTLELEREHEKVLDSASRARKAAQKAQVERLRAQQVLREHQVAALSVRAGAAGLVQELPLEVGEQVAIGARLAKVVDPKRLRAELRIPESRAAGVVVGQAASIELLGQRVRGRVVHIDPAVEGGNVSVDVAIEEPLPPDAKLDLSVDGRIELDRLDDVLRVEKPALGGGPGSVSLFKLGADGRFAHRVSVELGPSSVSTVQVISGLAEGDRVILSDMSQWDNADRIELQ